MKRNHSLIVLALTMMSLSACANGQQSASKTKVNPSSNFLISAINEQAAGKAGPMCTEITKDWIAQNAPKETK